MGLTLGLAVTYLITMHTALAKPKQKPPIRYYFIDVAVHYQTPNCDVLKNVPKPGEPKVLRVRATLSDGKGTKQSDTLTITRREFSSQRGSVVAVAWQHDSEPTMWQKVELVRSDVCAGTCGSDCDQVITALTNIAVKEAAKRHKATPPNPYDINVRCCAKRDARR